VGAAEQRLSSGFPPQPEPEYGHDPHCVRLHPLKPDRLYQQNHCGIYRMERAEGRWIRIGEHMPKKIGDIGLFSCPASRDPDTVWVFRWTAPRSGPVSPEGKPAVYVTRLERGRDRTGLSEDQPGGQSNVKP